MNINKAYKSNYMKAADLDGEDRDVTIAGLQMEKIQDDEKPVLYFEEFELGMVLNKTNAQAIAQVLQTTETNDWVGGRITLFPATVDFQGKAVEAIRVKLRAPKPKVAPQRQPAAAGAGGGSGKPNFSRQQPVTSQYESDDDIPI